MPTKPWVRPGILAAVLWIAANACHAQTTIALEHPLKRGLAAAWERQPEQRSTELRRDAVDAARRAALRWTPGAPALDLLGRSDRANGNAGAREYDAAVSVPLWLPGERGGTQALAQADGDALEARLGATRLSLAELLRGAYWNQARAVQEVELAQERLRNARGLASDVSRRVTAGDLARADAHQADGIVAAAEAAAAEAGANAARATRRWFTLTGLQPTDGDDSPTEVMPASDQPSPDHPALLELATRAESARRQRELAGVQQWANPEVSIGAVRERGIAGERYERTAVVSLRIPIGKSYASEARIASASADQLEAETWLALQTQRIASEAASARDAVRALEVSVDAADRRARLAREARGFFEKSFRLGETDLPTRLRIELESYEAERQASRTRLERAAAISSLRQALGLLPE